MKIVLFPHPGGEFDPRLAAVGQPVKCGWNLGAHKRRLLRSTGQYVDAFHHLQTGDLAFWSEWEAETNVTKLSPSAGLTVPGEAQWIHEPLPPTRCPKNSVDDLCCMNTDPCVFGDSFKYSLCRQEHFRDVMQNLDPGSLIYFGASCKDNQGQWQFYLDTLFVVSSRFPYVGPDHQHKVKCSRQYRLLTLDQTPSGVSLSFYRGRTVSEAEGGPYSFTPARKYGDPRGLFRHRFPLDCKGLNQFLTSQGIQYRKGKPFFNERKNSGVSVLDVSPQVAGMLWKETVQQVHGSSFVLGTHFDWS